MTDIRDQVEEFFERYAAALLARDAAAVAQLYAVPGLILFPDTSFR
jgi:ketosteroid isomerase-like protein